MILWAIFSALSIHFLLLWAKRDCWGKRSFTSSPVRSNNMPLWAPFLLLGFWGVSMATISKFLAMITGEDAANPFINQVSLAGSAAISALLGILMASIFFDGGLSGFGLAKKDIFHEFKNAVVALAKVWPGVIAVMAAIAYLVPLITGQKTTVPVHPMLDNLNLTNSGGLIVLIGIVAVILAPLLEEVLFRGFVQTKLSENLQSRWLAILLTSTFFAVVHGGELWSHWPSLFIFSCSLGYIYEKSGSLLQAVFMHAMFNGINIFLAVFSSRVEI